MDKGRKRGKQEGDVVELSDFSTSEVSRLTAKSNEHGWKGWAGYEQKPDQDSRDEAGLETRNRIET